MRIIHLQQPAIQVEKQIIINQQFVKQDQTEVLFYNMLVATIIVKIIIII